MLNELALFAGAGGGLLGTQLLRWRTVCAVEHDPYRQAVLLARQEDGHLDPFPIWSDVRDFDGRPWRGIVDVVTAGFPCQPFSVAGRQRGVDDERNMWPETIRVIREVGPRYALLENVPGLIGSGYFGTILGDLAEAGFDAEWCVLGADDVGAPHRRKRLWIAAHAIGERIRQQPGRLGCERSSRILAQRQDSVQSSGHGTSGDVADAASKHGEWSESGRDCGWQSEGAIRNSGDVANANITGLEERNGSGSRLPLTAAVISDWWAVEPNVGRVADGVPARVDRLAALGDGQVPAVVRAAWLLLTADG